jgi:hypothetical protein
VRLKEYRVAIKPGEQVMVPKIKLKSKHREFQLGGGGYGTFGDETSSNVNTAEAPKTKREKNLEAEIKRETDPARKRAMKEELPRKGMLLQDVDALLGPPAKASERKEGTLRVQARGYTTADGRVSAEFVEGVLIRYHVSSE